MYSGRALFWFDKEVLDSAWFAARFKKACAELGNRYTPETSIDLPLRQQIMAFARDPVLNEIIEEWGYKIQEHGQQALQACQRLSDHEDVSVMPSGLDVAYALLEEMFVIPPIFADEVFPVDDWMSAANEARPKAFACLKWASDQEVKKDKRTSSDPVEWCRNQLIRFIEVIDDIVDDLEGDRWGIANSQQLLVFGQAGMGKSHLLADSVAFELEHDRPAILLLGSKFIDDEPWRQIHDELDLPRHYNTQDVLGAIDAAAHSAGTRALIIIDAINERHGPEIWPHRLVGMLQDVRAFPRIGVLLSCRTTYMEHVIPETLSKNSLPRIQHSGFSNKHARTYLTLRGFTLPGTPNMLPELGNPLFLRTCCDALEKEGKHEFPRGLQGITAIFDFYLEAVTKVITKRLNLVPRRRIVETAIGALVSAFVDRQIGYMSVKDAFTLLDQIHQSSDREVDLLSQLESEGLLTIELLPNRWTDFVVI